MIFQEVKEYSGRTQKDFSVQDYMGRWYEVGRTFNPYQVGIKHSKADYTLLSDDRVGIINTGMKIDNETVEIQGEAKLYIGSNASFIVSFPSVPFPPPKKPNYIVIATDYDNYSIVGSYDKKSAYILSRRTPVPVVNYEYYKSILFKEGYDVSDQNWISDPLTIGENYCKCLLI